MLLIQAMLWLLNLLKSFQFQSIIREDQSTQDKRSFDFRHSWSPDLAFCNQEFWNFAFVWEMLIVRAETTARDSGWAHRRILLGNVQEKSGHRKTLF